jgi:type I restriction enzyme S subunit
MRKYDSYKDSGIEWLGKVPAQWKNHRIDWITSLVRGNTGLKKDELLDNGEYVALQYGKTYKVDEVNNTFEFFVNSEYYKKGQIVNFGDTVLISTSETIEDLGHSCFYNRSDLGLLGGEQILLKPNKKFVDEKYLYYYCKFFRYELQKYATGLKVFRFNIDDLKEILLALPLLYEQTAIAQYLDSKTQAIDKKVNLLEKKIGYYKELRKSIINETVTKGLDKTVKLKDSGIKWIGQIPEHWEVKRFKDVVSKYTTGGTPSTSNNAYFNGDNIWITIGDIGESNLVSTSSLFLTDEAIKDANIVKTPKGSLLYSFKLSIGKMAFTTVDCYTNEAILSIFPNKNIDLMYYYMMLPTFMMLAATENIYGAKMLNQKLIANAFVLHPPKPEQTKIATYLDHKTQTIDKIVGNIQNQITTLKELRKTLINDVVTGKIKVVE